MKVKKKERLEPWSSALQSSVIIHTIAFDKQIKQKDILQYRVLQVMVAVNQHRYTYIQLCYRHSTVWLHGTCSFSETVHLKEYHNNHQCM